MNIAIIGSNPRAQAIARLFESGGNDVVSGHPYKLAMTSDILVLAVRPDELDEALAQAGADITAVVLDAIEHEAHGPVTGAELIARKLDSHRVVRAIVVNPRPNSNFLICGDDDEAKALVDAAFRSCGCLTTDRGPLSNADQLEAPTPVPVA